MRLIDLDKVRWEEGFYDMHTGEQFAPMMFNTKECLEWATANAKVKAIPIERIKSKIDAILNIYPNGNEETEVLCKLLYEWEKENENS